MPISALGFPVRDVSTHYSVERTDPEWLQGYDDPVIVSVGGSRGTLHAPNPRADSPEPICSGLDANWRVVDRRVVPTAKPCEKLRCAIQFSD